MVKLEIVCHNGDTFVTEAENYDPVALSEQINSNEVLAVAIGELLFSRIDIKRVIPIKD